MTIFAILMPSPQPAIAEAIKRQYPNDYLYVTDTQYLISANGTAIDEDIKSHRHSDFVFHITVLAAGFLVLGGMLIFGYFRLDDRITKSDDKINTLTNAVTRINTQLEDLLERIPPVQTPVPTKR